MTHTDAMAVGDIQKALGGCMIPGGFQVGGGDLFAVPQIFSTLIQNTLAGFTSYTTDKIVKSPYEVLFGFDPYRVWTDIFRDGQVVQAETFLAWQKALGLEIVPSGELEKFIKENSRRLH